MTRGTWRPALVTSAVALALAACTYSPPDRAGGQGLQEPTVLTIAQLDDIAPAQVRAYATEVERQSHGTLQIDFKDSWHKGEVDFDIHTLDDVIGGRVQGAWVGVGAMDLIGVTSFQPLVAPLLVDSHAFQERVFSEGIPLEMARGLEGHGLVAIAVLPGPMRKVLGVRQPFLELRDFRLSVLGIQGGDVPESTARALGATFSRMPSGAGLTGVDAYEQQVENIFSDFYGLEAKYVTANVNLWPQAMAVVLNDATYRSLSDAQRDVLRRAAADAVPAALTATRDGEEAGVSKLCGQQVAFPRASERQLEALRRDVQPVYDNLSYAPQNARMLERLIQLKAAVNAPPEVSACSPGGSPAVARSFPDGTYDLVLEHDPASHCVDDPTQGAPESGIWFSLEVAGDKVTVRRRLDGQSTPQKAVYNGVFSQLHDRIRINRLAAGWSFDGTDLRFSDLDGGSCGEGILWTSRPWVLRYDASSRESPVLPDGTYETVLSPEERHLCDGRPGMQHLNREVYDPPSHPMTWYVSFVLDRGNITEYESEVSPSSGGRMGWAGSYSVHGDTFELTDLRSTVNYPAVTDRRPLLAASFTFDGKALTLTAQGAWPCDAKVLWTSHPWTLTRKAP